MEVKTEECQNCDGAEWVCENHRDRPWDGHSDREDACGCGAGAPCPVCRPDMANARLISALRKTRDRLEGVLGQFDFAGCTCTFPSDDCCSYAAAEVTLVEADKALAGHSPPKPEMSISEAVSAAHAIFHASKAREGGMAHD